MFGKIIQSIISAISNQIPDKVKIELIKYVTQIVNKDYNKYLTSYYGDYMTPPPEDKRVVKHNLKIYTKEH